MSYTKLALSLLDNWMKQNNFVFKSDSIFTESLYYSKNNINVRISAHLPCNISSETIYIMVPSNKKGAYGIFWNKYYISKKSIADVKSFLLQYFELNNITMIPSVKLSDAEKDVKIQNQRDLIAQLQNKLTKLKK